MYKVRDKDIMFKFNESALTDHATTDNHIIDREGTKLIDNEPNRRTR